MTQIGKFQPVNLLGGAAYRATKGVMLAKGQLYPAGAVLAKQRAGNCVLVDSKTDDKTAYAVLAGEVDATEGDTPGIAYLTGEFNRNQLVFGGYDSYATHELAARTAGLIFVDSETIPE